MKSLIDNEIPELLDLKINPKKQLEIAESSHSLCLSRSEQPKSRGVADLWQKSEMSKKVSVFKCLFKVRSFSNHQSTKI